MAKIVALAKAMIWGITRHWVKLAVLFYCALSIFGLLLPTRLELIFRSTSHAISDQGEPSASTGAKKRIKSARFNHLIGKSVLSLWAVVVGNLVSVFLADRSRG